MQESNLFLETFMEGNGLSYVVGDRGAGSLAVIDPHQSLVPSYMETAKRLGAKIKLVLETHLHEDHLSGALSLKQETGCEIVAGQGHVGKGIDRHVTGGIRIRLGAIQLNVLSTPGHAREAVCYAGPGFIFTGDTLLIGGCGRTDLPGSDLKALYGSLKKILSLPDETEVHPGKSMTGEKSSSIGKERSSNPFLLLRDEATFVAHLKALALPAPMNAKYYLLCNERGLAEETSDISSDEAWALLQKDRCTLLDVGTMRQHDEMRIDPSFSVPLEDLGHRWRDLVNCLPPLIIVSGSPGTAGQAKAILQEKGLLGVRCLEGGFRSWRDKGYPLYRKVTGIWLYRISRLLLVILSGVSGGAALLHGVGWGALGLAVAGTLLIEGALGKDLIRAFRKR